MPGDIDFAFSQLFELFYVLLTRTVASQQVRTYNLREVKPLRNLDPQHIDQMVALRGMVIRTSQIIPDLKQAFFRCIVCNASKEVRKPIHGTVAS